MKFEFRYSLSYCHYGDGRRLWRMEIDGYFMNELYDFWENKDINREENKNEHIRNFKDYHNFNVARI